MSDKRTTGESQEKGLPTLEELLAEIEITKPLVVERKYVERFSEEAIGAEEKYEHLKGLKMHYAHKAGWSVYLAALMGLMIVFQIVLLVKVGSGDWDFTKYAWLLPALLVQNLAQVIGLAVIVVKSLFKDLRG